MTTRPDKDDSLRELWDLGTAAEWLEVFEGAYRALEDRLEWTEQQYDNGTWHVLVSLPEFDWAGNDGHLLSRDREASRRAAFFSLLSLLGSENNDA